MGNSNLLRQQDDFSLLEEDSETLAGGSGSPSWIYGREEVHRGTQGQFLLEFEVFFQLLLFQALGSNSYTSGKRDCLN